MNLRRVKNLLEINDGMIAYMESNPVLLIDKNNLDILYNSQAKLKDRRYVVSIIAAMKAGKSTAFNALIGRDLLPNENAACTTAITEIKHSQSPSDQIMKIKNDGTEIIIKADDTCSLENKFLEDVRTSRRDNSVASIRKYYVETPIAAIENNEYSELVQNFLLVDTPGPDEAATEDFDVSLLQKIALEQLRNSDALVMIFDYQRFKSDVNQRLLQNIFENREDLREDQDKVVFLLNKIDAMTTKDGLVEDAVESVKGLIKFHAPIIKEPKVYPVSAKQANLARSVINGCATQENKKEMEKCYASEFYTEVKVGEKKLMVVPSAEEFAEPLLEKSGIKRFEEEVIENIFNRSSEKMIKNAYERMERVLKNIRKNVDSQSSMLKKESEDLQRVVKMSKNEFLKLKDRGQLIKEIPNKYLADLKSVISDILYSLKAEAKTSCMECFPKERILESESEVYLTNQINSTYNTVNQMVEVILNRSYDKVQRASFEAQREINKEIEHSFGELIKLANEVIGNNLGIDLQVFTLEDLEFFSLNKMDGTITDHDTNEVAGRKNEFDGVGAVAGTTAGIAAGTAIGAAVGSVVPIIGTAIGGAVGAGIGALIGFFKGGNKEDVVYEKRKVYSLDLEPIRIDLTSNIDRSVDETVKNVQSGLESLMRQYSKFVEKQLDVFIANLDRQLDDLVEEYESNKNRKEDRLKELEEIAYQMKQFKLQLESI